VRCVVSGTRYKASPSRPNALTSESYLLRSEERERFFCLPCPFCEMVGEKCSADEGSSASPRGCRASGRYCTIRGKLFYPVTVLLAVIGDVWLRVCAEPSPRVLGTSSPHAEQLENPPRPRRRCCRGRSLPLSPTQISVGRYETLCARRPRQGLVFGCDVGDR
jgi:hypothetical protein